MITADTSRYGGTPASSVGEEDVPDSFTDESAFDLGLACSESRIWLEAVLQEKFGEPQTVEGFHEAIRDGQRLCRFINCIKAGSVKKINKMKVPFACMENLTWFLEACRRLGLKDTQLFTSTDAYGANEGTAIGSDEAAVQQAMAQLKKEKDRKLRDVCITIYWLGRAVRAMADYSGPQLNLAAFVKLSCTSCSGSILDNNYVVDGPRNFHTKCFSCGVCGKNPIDEREDYKWDSCASRLACSKCRCNSCRACLSPGGYRVLNPEGDKICPTCDKSTRCTTCRAILPDPAKAHTVNNNRYCDGCYCAERSCGQPFINNKYADVNGKRYCPACLCFSCGALAGPDHVVSDGRKYCSNCHCAAQKCKKPFTNKRFVDVDGRRFCPDCVCVKCNKLAGSDWVPLGDRKVCRDCYCADCKKPFGDAGFKEVDGSRYCPDCMCHAPGCDRWPGPNPSYAADGLRYCPDCVCADRACRAPLVPGQSQSLPDGSRVCLQCLCGVCGVYVGESARIKRNDTRYCAACTCHGCRIPLTQDVQRSSDTADSNGRFFCTSCACERCNAGIKRKDARQLHLGKQYCSGCLCAICSTPFAAEQGQKPFGSGLACADCLCRGCGQPASLTDRVKYGDAVYHRACACATCLKPVADDTKTVRGNATYCRTCACAQCGTPIPATTKPAWGEWGVCGSCACSRCGRPERPRLGERVAAPLPFVRAGGANVCSACTCRLCQSPLRKTENAYCSKCVCRTCEVVLGQDEVAQQHCGQCRPLPAKPVPAKTTTAAPAPAVPAAAAAAAQPAKGPAPVAKAGGCAKCGDDIKGPMVMAMDRSFHVACFVCTSCNKQLKAGYLEHEAQPYCDQCYGTAAGVGRCADCKGTLVGSVIVMDQQSWHKDCFKCGHCKALLAKGTKVHMMHGQPHCATCYTAH